MALQLRSYGAARGQNSISSEMVKRPHTLVRFEEAADGRVRQRNLGYQERGSARKALSGTRRSLPIYRQRTELIEAIRSHDSLVVVGETGSGKTTQLAQYVLEAGDIVPSGCLVAVTQPRRVAAISVAERVAQEMGCRLGDTVGYQIRFDDRTSNRTRLKFATDGMLLRESLRYTMLSAVIACSVSLIVCISDPLLQRYAVVILDEAHERTVHTDVLMALVRRAQKRRRASGKALLRIVAMSATIEAERFAAYLDSCPVVQVQGRTFPVSIMYLSQPEPDYIDAALIAVLQLHIDNDGEDGDILVFLTGQEDIETLTTLLNERAKALPPGSRRLLVRPIFAAMPQSQQMTVFERTPPNHRKVVLATNIAETSLTIDGIRFVVDSGLAKKRSFHSRTGIDALVPLPIAKSEAAQRAGRAGRQQAGYCYRLYTERSYESLAATATPEIRRCNLAACVLQLKGMGVAQLLEFEFLDPPPRESLLRALMQLYELEALDASGELTELGRRMTSFPLDPHFSKALLAADSFGCLRDVVTIVAVLSSDAVFYYPRGRREEADDARKRFVDPSGDHLTLLNVYRAVCEVGFDRHWCEANFVNLRSLRKASSIRSQLASYCGKLGLQVDDVASSNGVAASRVQPDAVLRCLVSSLFLQTAVLQPDLNSYRTQTDSQTVFVHPTSALFGRRRKPHCVIYTELVRTSKDYMRFVSEIDMRWLPELAPRLFTRRQHNPEQAPEVPAIAQAQLVNR